MNHRSYAATLASNAANAPDQELLKTAPNRKQIASIEVEIAIGESFRSFDPEVFIKEEREKVVQSLESKVSHTYLPHLFDKDIKRLEKTYVILKSDLRSSLDGYHLFLRVEKKPHIDKIEWEGNTHLSSRTINDLPVKEGEIFDFSSLVGARRHIEALYRKKGFYEPQVEAKTAPSTKAGHINLLFEIKEGGMGFIRSIEFEGVTSKEIAPIQKKLYTQVRGFFNTLLSMGGWYVQEMVEADRATIAEFFQDAGYVDVQVTAKKVTSLDPKAPGVAITFVINKGPIYRVGELEIDQSESEYQFSAKELAKLIKISKGDLYSPSKVNKASNALSKSLGSKGYYEAFASITPVLSDAQEVASLVVKIYSGKKYHVGMIHVTGNHITRPRVVLHELLVAPGAPYNTPAITASERRLKRTELFEQVHITAKDAPSASSDGKNYKDLVVDVEEADGFGKFAFRVGASNRDLGHVGFEIADRNFYLGGIKRLPKQGIEALRGNGEYVSANIQIAQRSLQHNLSWTYPYVAESPWTLSLNFDKGFYRDQKSYDNHKEGATAQITRTLGPFTTLRFYTALRNDKVKIRSDASEEISASIQGQQKFSGPMLSANTSLSYNSADDPFFATKGTRTKSSLGVSKILNKNITYANLVQENALYLKLNHDFTLKFKGDLRFLLPFGKKDASELPINSKFLIGGESTLRGYGYRSVGPYYVEDQAQGGISVAAGSVELMYRINEMMGLFAFYDVASISDQRFSLERPYHSAGYGFRVNIAKRMPLTIGMGYPFRVEHPTQNEGFFFEVGGTF